MNLYEKKSFRLYRSDKEGSSPNFICNGGEKLESFVRKTVHVG